MNELAAIIILGLVLVVQAVERYFYAKDMSQKLQDCIKAVMSRNISEYIAATNISKEKDEPEPENDQVDLSTLDDKEYSKVIAKM